MKSKEKIERPFNWSSGLFIIGYHIILAVLLPLYLFFYSPSGLLLGISFLLLYLTGLSITAGYHRLFSHSTYKTNRVIKAILLFFGSMATQGSALRWSHDHRVHHAHVDEDEDPYSVKKGFWYAHILWMFKKQPPIEDRIVSDLKRDKLIMFQHKYYEWTMVVTNVLVMVLVGFITGDFLGAFVFAWVLRLFVLHHSTWFINSLAHYWGHQNFSTEHSAVDNYVISLLTFGEGYHNYHHTFANDYRNGIHWYHFDPTKWLIWGLSKCGLAHNLRKVNEVRIHQQMIEEHKNALLERLKDSYHAKKEELEKKVALHSDSLCQKISKMQALATDYKTAATEAPSEALAKLSQEIKDLRKHLKAEWREWHKFSKFIMKTPVMAGFSGKPKH